MFPDLRRRHVKLAKNCKNKFKNIEFQEKKKNIKNAEIRRFLELFFVEFDHFPANKNLYLEMLISENYHSIVNMYLKF